MLTSLDLHPEHRNARYTLRGLFDIQEDADAKAERLAESGLDVYLYEEEAPDGSTLYGVAARHSVDPAARTGIPHRHSADWTVTRAANNLFRRIMRAAKGSRAYRWYKPLDIDLLNSRIRAISWNGSHLDVAARIISDLILAHPFPNANHRTSIHLARSYLQACGIKWPHYSLRGQGAKRLHRETKDFFIESKYLLQLYRHPELLRKAYDAGYRRLHIGPEADAEIRAADLVRAKEEVKNRHFAAARKMVKELARGEEVQKLHTPRTKGLREWAQTISGQS